MPVMVNSCDCRIWGTSPPTEYPEHETIF